MHNSVWYSILSSWNLNIVNTTGWTKVAKHPIIIVLYTCSWDPVLYTGITVNPMWYGYSCFDLFLYMTSMEELQKRALVFAFDTVYQITPNMIAAPLNPNPE